MRLVPVYVERTPITTYYVYIKEKIHPSVLNVISPYLSIVSFGIVIFACFKYKYIIKKLT